MTPKGLEISFCSIKEKCLLKGKHLLRRRRYIRCRKRGVLHFHIVRQKCNMQISIDETNCLITARKTTRYKRHRWQNHITSVRFHVFWDRLSHSYLTKEILNQNTIEARISGYMRGIVWWNRWHLKVKFKVRICNTNRAFAHLLAVKTKRLISAPEMRALGLWVRFYKMR